MTSFGRINEFQAENESIGAYLERVELFFQANDIADGKKVAVFLSVIGGKTYTLLCNLLSPTKPQEKSFDFLAEELKKHFEPKKVVIAERFRFHRRDQAVGEEISDYVAELRKLTKDCEFEGYLEEALRDRFVCGLRNEATQKRLLTKSGLTFVNAVEIAKGMEAAEKNSQQLKGTEAQIQPVHGTREEEQVRVCYRCGNSGHTPANSRFKDASIVRKRDTSPEFVGPRGRNRTQEDNHVVIPIGWDRTNRTRKKRNFQCSR